MVSRQQCILHVLVLVLPFVACLLVRLLFSSCRGFTSFNVQWFTKDVSKIVGLRGLDFSAALLTVAFQFVESGFPCWNVGVRQRR